MLEELVAIHQEVMSMMPTHMKRFIHHTINWDAKAICIHGARGVGKTTTLCQFLLDRYKTAEHALYFSADNINVISIGIFKIAREYFSLGGQALFIDEIHKYPNWSTEVKNILDTYRNRQIIFSGSSDIALQHSKADLSRRVVYHYLPGLSFREYLELGHNIVISTYSLDEIVKDHMKIAAQFNTVTILKLFREYLQFGYYPFFLEGLTDYLSRVNNIVEKVIFEDIALVNNLKQTTLPGLKKLLWLVATSGCFIPNVDRISKSINISREIVYNCLEYLKRSCLVNNIFEEGRGMKLVRKPGKILLDNTNLLYAINGSLKFDSEIGGVRETFFVNQVAQYHRVNSHDKADFIVDEHYVFEIGGRGKNHQQIQQVENAYLAVDGIEIGFGKKIPLYLFGLLY